MRDRVAFKLHSSWLAAITGPGLGLEFIPMIRKELFDMKFRIFITILFMVAIMLIPSSTLAKVGIINVSDGAWDSNWGTNIDPTGGSVDGYYLNVDAFPDVTTYYFGIDANVVNFNVGTIWVRFYMDCNLDGDFDGETDLYALANLNDGVPESLGLYNGDGTIVGPLIFEVVEAPTNDRIEMAGTVTSHDINDCAGSPNRTYVENAYSDGPPFSTQIVYSTPTAIELRSFSAEGNRIPGHLHWIAGVAIVSIAGVVALQIHRGKKSMEE
jgi:hypothetical protein